ncbi:hypothetical protein [uncultured Bradyrhizobium sp.]|uniref:hypothetical protein n=1 Tax=uncultured Bradyrhizobium sp. TaxID=199684 RepID=UPI0035CB9DAA
MAQDDIARIEESIRAAAKAAARGVPLGEAVLSRIVAETNQPGISIADRLSRAGAIAEQYAASPKPLNEISAAPQDIAAQSKATMAFGARVAGGHRPGISESGRESSKSNYQVLGNSDPRSMQAVTSANFAGSAFAQAGLDFGTFSYLRGQDRSFTTQNILNAANDAKALGFGPKDRAAVLDHTIIDRYDRKARVTNRALQAYQERIEGDEELAELHDKSKHAETMEEKNACAARIAEKRTQLAKESGLTDRAEDAENHPKAKAATKRRKTAIEKKAERSYEARAGVKASAPPPKPNATQNGAALFSKLTASPK